MRNPVACPTITSQTACKISPAAIDFPIINATLAAPLHMAVPSHGDATNTHTNRRRVAAPDTSHHVARGPSQLRLPWRACSACPLAARAWHFPLRLTQTARGRPLPWAYQSAQHEQGGHKVDARWTQGGRMVDARWTLDQTARPVCSRPRSGTADTIGLSPAPPTHPPPAHLHRGQPPPLAPLAHLPACGTVPCALKRPVT